MSDWGFLESEPPIDMSGLKRKGINTQAELNRASIWRLMWSPLRARLPMSLHGSRIKSTLVDFPPLTSKSIGAVANLALSMISGQTLSSFHAYSCLLMCIHCFDMQKNVSFASLSAASSDLFLRMRPSPLIMIQGGSSPPKMLIHSVSAVVGVNRGSSSWCLMV